MIVKPGVILLGEEGDNVPRPAWAKDGSFLAWRQLEQLVPEFTKFLDANAFSIPGFTHEQNVDLLGARMTGRWKSVGFQVANASVLMLIPILRELLSISLLPSMILHSVLIP